jgi:hypothetical protein
MKKVKYLIAAMLMGVAFFGCSVGDDSSKSDTDKDADGYTETQGDCDDTDASIYPGAKEVCDDGIDQDCTGADSACTPDPDDTDDDKDGYTENQGDCDDNDADIHPGADDICEDGIDQDCNGEDMSCCTPDPNDCDDDKDGYTENQGDCDDTKAEIYPGAEEVCDDGIDQDCSGADMTCAPDPDDTDDDKDGYTENQGDCNDNDAAIHPGANDICDDGIDQDCSGTDCESSEDTVYDYARDNKISMQDEDIDLFMQRISADCLHNGQDYNCYEDIQKWAFENFDYDNISYQISEILYETEGSSDFATITRTHTYTQYFKFGGETDNEFVGDVPLVFEDGKWKFFGNQQGYPQVTVSNMATGEYVDETTGSLVGAKNLFTNLDDTVMLFVQVGNVSDGTVFTVRCYQPDGTLFSENPYTVQAGAYPACMRISSQWYQSYNVLDPEELGIPSDIPLYEEIKAENTGIWKIEVSLDGAGVLGQTTFEYQYE